MEMNKKVLVVGGAGYIGGLTSDTLIRNGHDVTIYDNLLYENRYLKDIKFIHGDIRDYKKLTKVSEDFDVIVLMAALVGDPACSVDQELTEVINYKSIKKACESIPLDKHVNIFSFMFMSMPCSNKTTSVIFHLIESFNPTKVKLVYKGYRTPIVNNYTTTYYF